MRITALDFVDILKQLEWLRGASLSGPDKLSIYKEMEASLPPDQLCGAAQQSLRIVRQELEHGRAKETPSAGKKRAKKPAEKHTETEPLLQQLDENARRPRPKKAVVKQAKA
jgi:hypothetical protein